jgi:hypothetical protein
VNMDHVSPAPRSLVRIANRTFATYDAAAFLDTRVPDVGGRTASPGTRQRACKGEGQRVAVAVAILAVLATLSLIALLSLKVVHP